MLEFPALHLVQGEMMELLDEWEEKTDARFFESLALPIWKLMHASQIKVLKYLEQIEKTSKHIRKEKLPINGHFLKDRLSDSKEISEHLRKLRISYRNGEWKSLEDAERLLESWKHLLGPNLA